MSVLVGRLYQEAWLHALLPFPLVLIRALVLSVLHLLAALLQKTEKETFPGLTTATGVDNLLGNKTEKTALPQIH